MIVMHCTPYVRLKGEQRIPVSGSIAPVVFAIGSCAAIQAMRHLPPCRLATGTADTSRRCSLPRMLRPVRTRYTAISSEIQLPRSYFALPTALILGLCHMVIRIVRNKIRQS